MQINFFTFRPVQQVVELSLYTEKHNDTHPERVYANECPEMVAEIVPHFSDAELPQFGKNNLWFL
ncbi:MAG: hypothetical protein K6G31_08155 [Paludibacteraceae bacterium]|nr:hypothetical protein [Paludibacteraceae bacterium]